MTEQRGAHFLGCYRSVAGLELLRPNTGAHCFQVSAILRGEQSRVGGVEGSLEGVAVAVPVPALLPLLTDFTECRLTLCHGLAGPRRASG